MVAIFCLNIFCPFIFQCTTDILAVANEKIPNTDDKHKTCVLYPTKQQKRHFTVTQFIRVVPINFWGFLVLGQELFNNVKNIGGKSSDFPYCINQTELGGDGDIKVVIFLTLFVLINFSEFLCFVYYTCFSWCYCILS